MTTMLCLLGRLNPQTHNGRKGRVGVNQAGLGLSDVHPKTIIGPLTSKVISLKKDILPSHGSQ